MTSSSKKFLYVFIFGIIILLLWPLLTYYRGPIGHFEGELGRYGYRVFVWKDSQLCLASFPHFEEDDVDELGNCLGSRGYNEGNQIFKDRRNLVAEIRRLERSSNLYSIENDLLMYNDKYIRFLTDSFGSSEESATDFIYSIIETENERKLRVDRAVYKGFREVIRMPRKK